MSDLVITERATSTWNYHLRRPGSEGLKPGGGTLTMLCGKTMLAWDTKLPVSTWGLRDHIPSTWCKGCEEARDSC